MILTSCQLSLFLNEFLSFFIKIYALLMYSSIIIDNKLYNLYDDKFLIFNKKHGNQFK